MDLLWRLQLYFRSRRPLHPHARRRARWLRPRPWQVTLLVGVLLAAAVIGFLEARLRPMVVTAAQAQAQNAIAGVIEHAIWEQLGEEEITYSDLVTIQRDSAGTITALTTNTAAEPPARPAAGGRSGGSGGGGCVHDSDSPGQPAGL